VNYVIAVVDLYEITQRAEEILRTAGYGDEEAVP